MGLGQDLGLCISNKFPHEADAAGEETRQLGWKNARYRVICAHGRGAQLGALTWEGRSDDRASSMLDASKVGPEQGCFSPREMTQCGSSC